jgi:hypothetical protein
MTIDDIYKEVEYNGFANLSDEEVAQYVAAERDIAAKEASAAERAALYDGELTKLAEKQAAVASAADDLLAKLTAAPVNLRTV